MDIITLLYVFFLFQNATVIVGNETYISDNIADNPNHFFYQTVYGSFILVILATSLLRGFAFTKVIIISYMWFTGAVLTSRSW